ncbi:MAG TPA: TadE/TadG family type IV pilus assembly protein [Bryobacteraceae bacterium]|nr:TadE/TadG family type IV pilus assembly protein [Bryobacteraceae bacterium]
MKNDRSQQSRRGSVFVELALSSGLLFLLFFGVVDFARLFAAADMVADSACAATQYGALSPAHYGDFTGMQNAALTDAMNPPNMTAVASQFCTCSIGGSHLSCPTDCGGGSSGQMYLEVDVTLPFSTLISWPGIGGTMNLSRTSIVRVQ